MRHLWYVSWLALFVAALAAPVWGQQGKDSYAGTEACLSCHEKQATVMKNGPHWKKAVSDSPINGQGCESCHGPGAAHAEAGGGKAVGGMIAFKKGESSEKKSGACLSCHENGPKLALWDSGIHKKKDVSCNDCHTLHGASKGPKGYGTGLKPLGYSPGSEYQTCTKCHLNVKAEVNRRSHHPIIEGRVTCSDCHQPHGATGPSQIKADSIAQLCYKCHAEKRGPYMWEHQPVNESCAACHKPHGSVHVRLLAEKVPNLCQGCHEGTRHPSTRYSRETMFNGSAPSSRGFGRSCLNCHVAIHGSNAPALPGSLGNSGTYFLR